MSFVNRSVDAIDESARKWRPILFWHLLFLTVSYLYFSILSWDLLWFTTANPGILGSGIRGDSKFDTLKKLRIAAGARWLKAVPTTVRIPLRADDPIGITELKEAMESRGKWERTDNKKLQFPVIAKPDLGANGWRVYRIDNMKDLERYAATASYDFLLQEYIDSVSEVGVFYYRMPGEQCGALSDIISKESLSVVGNGRDSLETLIASDAATKRLRKKFVDAGIEQHSREELESVVPEGKKVNLGRPDNSHFWGKTLDMGHLADESLRAMLDDLSHGFEDGFYYGRFDMRLAIDTTTANLSLIDPSTIRILELNGVGSVPSCIMQEGFTIRQVWVHCWPHWKTCWQIAIENKRRGVKSMTISKARAVLAMIKESKYQEGIW